MVLIAIILKNQSLSDYDVALNYLNEQYGLSKVEYKLYNPNLLRNDVYINHYQQIYCDFDVVKPKNKLTRKTNEPLEMIYSFNIERKANKQLDMMYKKDI